MRKVGKKKQLVGELQYIDMRGKVCEIIPYYDAEKMKMDLLEDMECGRPVLAKVFQRKGEPIAVTAKWFYEHCSSTFARLNIMPERQAQKGERVDGR